MPHTIREKVNEWSRSRADEDPDYENVYRHVLFMAERRYEDYLPALRPLCGEFLPRLRDWLNQVDDDDQRTLFALVREISYVGRNEFACLYRAAFSGPVARWLVEQSGVLDLTVEGLATELADSLASTWFCPITDSMDIAAFYHVNGLAGGTIRPDWRSLRTLSTADALSEHMEHRYERVVLLEDFVGSGDQMSRALDLALELVSDYPVLVCPLMVCPDGLAVGREYEKLSRGRLTFSHLYLLKSGTTLSAPASPEQERLFERTGDVARRTYTEVTASQYAVEDPDGYGPLGWKKSGALVVAHSNTPDNTIPLIHHQSAKWNALFPRAPRG